MYLICVFLLLCIPVNNADVPCAARSVSGQSVVCVCNATYCDTITADAPGIGAYTAYTSSEAGLRFRKSSGTLTSYDYSSRCCSVTLELDVATQYQSIEGFGGAVTDSASINWRSLSEPLQKYFVDSYFSASGIEYNMIRVPIGGSDFSTHLYAYNELPENDVKLTNFSLSVEDYQFKLPLIRQAMQVANTPIHVLASTWAPPTWMKFNHVLAGVGFLKHEYYQTYADYHHKFLEEYTKEGVPIWGITLTNEPMSVTMGWMSDSVGVGWTSTDMGKWLVHNLGPTIRNSVFKDVKIIVGDDQRFLLPYLFNLMVIENPKTLQYIDGAAVHSYTNFMTPASIITLVTRQYPDKFIIGSEACQGNRVFYQKSVVLGSWQRAVYYIKNIIEDLNYNLVGWVDWNICLNEQGGPNWMHNYVDSPILVSAERDDIYKQPMFYAMGHFSKFIPRGSRRIHVTEHKSFLEKSVENVAFLTPRNTVVAVLYNDARERTVRIKFGNQQAVIPMKRRSITSVEIRNFS